MRNIVFLLVMAFAVAGLSWADGGIANSPEVLALDAGLFEYGGYEAVIASDTVSVGELLMVRHERLAGLLASPETADEISGKSQGIWHGFMSISHKPDYWLRL